jgi:hypothetical protein
VAVVTVSAAVPTAIFHVTAAMSAATFDVSATVFNVSATAMLDVPSALDIAVPMIGASPVVAVADVVSASAGSIKAVGSPAVAVAPM